MAVLALVAFAACSDDDKNNDDDDKDDDALTGTFADVANLHYATATQSGLTGAQGEFRYLAGENVTFSVGGITLGSAVGAEHVTPFTLFNVTPPTTEVATRRVLGDRLLTDFDRAANVATFLYALDEDRDPSNGLDLGDWDTALADATLSFDHEMRYFVFQVFNTFASYHPGIFRFVRANLGLAHLYASEQIIVPAHRLTSTTRDVGNDGSIDSSTRYEYDAQHRTTARREDRDDDGSDNYVVTYTYDAMGSTGHTSELDDDGDGVYERREVVTQRYNATGDLTEESRSRTEYGVELSGYSYAATFNELGHFLTATRDSDQDGDSTVDHMTETYTNDARGNPTSVRYETDYGSDAVLEVIEVVDTTYDANNKRVTGTSTKRNGAGVQTDKYVTSYTYDARGHETRRVQERRNAADVATQIYIVERTSDVLDRELTSDESTDEGADGTADSSSGYAREFDPASGLVATYEYRGDSDADGVPDYTETTNYTIDENTNVTQRLGSIDANGDGTIDSRSRATYVYSIDGVQTSYVTERDDNGDGEFGDAPESGTATYDVIADGAALLIDRAYYADED